MSILRPDARRRREDGPPSASTPRGELGQIRHLFRFLRPYRGVIVVAVVALCVSAAAVLALGQGPARPDR